MRTRVLFGAVAAIALVVAAGASTAVAGPATTVKVVLGSKPNEFALRTSVKSVHAGKVTFVVRNGGKLAHEFVIMKTATPAAKLPMSGGRASEKGAVGEIGEFASGLTKRVTLTLKPGHYVLLCNVAGHYVGGQHLDFNVTKSTSV